MSFSLSFPGVQKPLDQYGSSVVEATGGEEEKDEDDDFELFGSDDDDDAEEVSDVQPLLLKGMYGINCFYPYM